MFRLVLSLISSLQIGERIKETVERSLRQAVFVAIALLLLLFAFCFGLVAAYQALVVYGCSPIAAAGIVGGALALLGILILAIVPSLGKPKKRQTPSLVDTPAESIAAIDEGVGKAMTKVGPLTLLIIAFAAGLLASRRR